MILMIKMSSHQYWWLGGGYDLEMELFRSGYHGGYLVYSAFFRVFHSRIHHVHKIARFLQVFQELIPKQTE